MGKKHRRCCLEVRNQDQTVERVNLETTKVSASEVVTYYTTTDES